MQLGDEKRKIKAEERETHWDQKYSTGEGETYEDHTSENLGHRSKLKLELGLGPTLRILELKWQRQEKQEFDASLGYTEALYQGVKTNDSTFYIST